MELARSVSDVSPGSPEASEGVSGDQGSADGAIETLSPDLAESATNLKPRFPLIARRTGLVLAEGAPGELCAFWQLSSHDLAPAAVGFARDGGTPVPVLRLRRLRGDGAELVQEVPLRLSGPRGQGEQVFRVAPQRARYDAELGLSASSGGWVLLARSNAFDLAARVGLRLDRQHPQDASPASAGGFDAIASARSEQDMAVPTSVALPGSLAGSPPVSATPAVSLELGSESGPDAVPATGFAGGDQHGVAIGEAMGGGAIVTPQQDLSAWSDPALGSPGPHGSESSGEDHERLMSGSGADGSIPPLVYGRPTPRGSELIIEAELRVNGCAPPGSEIDLFGRPFRVGPGGRFQIVIRVDDAALIRRAFELNPPALLDRSDHDEGHGG